MGTAASVPSGQVSHKKILQRNYIYLRDHLITGELLDYLFQEEVLDRREFNRLRKIDHEEDRTEALIEKIEQKDRGTFGKFLQSLETSHSFVIDYLEKKTGVSLRKEFQVDSPIQIDHVVLQNLQKEKQDLELKLKELEKKHEDQLKEIHLKLKEQAQGKETEGTKKELKEEISRLKSDMDSRNTRFEREKGDLKTEIINHEKRIMTLEQSQMEGKSLLEVTQKKSALTDDEKISSLQMPAHTPADMETFFEACRRGRLVEMRRLLSQGLVDINSRGKEGRTAVMIAAWYSQEIIFDFLVQDICDLSLVDDNNDSLIHFACYGGSKNIVKKLLENHKVNIECRGMSDRTPLMKAVGKGHLPLVKFLQNKGANINTVDDNNNNILHVASIGGHVDMVEYVLSLNIADMECRGAYGRTPLMKAVEKGHLPLVKYIRNKGANINTVDDNNDNILHVASLGGNVDMVEYVLSLNIADMECRGAYGRTPLMCAVEKGHLPLVKYIRNKGANINTVEDNNNNILHVASLGGHVDMVEYVLSLNITDMECRDAYGRTPLMKAVEKGHLPLVKFLQNKGANINTVDNTNNNILHVASIGGHVDMVEYVLSHNITDMECRCAYGRTPLLKAVWGGNLPLVKFLQNKGANINTVDDNNNNILHVDSLGGHVDMVEYVLSLNITDMECRGAYGRTPLMKAVEKGHLPLVKYIRNKGANINTVDENNNNILHVASIGGHVDMVEYVLSLNISDMECRGAYGRTPLMKAVEKGHLPLVKYIRNKGANINTVDENNNNILHVASIGGHVDMVEYVLSLNISDMECRGAYGRTPLMKAVEKGHLPLVKYIRNKGANINTVDDNNNNILHVASLGGHVDMVEYVLSLNITDMECRGAYGRTPLMCAVEKGHLPLVKYIRNKGANINTVDENNNNILHVASIGGHVDMVEYVLSLNISDMECRGAYRRTPLMKAVEKGHLPLVKYIRNKGANINTVDENNNNILHVASIGGHVDMVEYVLSLNISDMECRGAYGRTPLMCAVEKGHLPLVKYIRNKGANINTVDENNNNILHVASIGGHVDMVEYVLSLNISDMECRGAYGRTPLMCAVEKGHLPLVKYIRNKGANINTVDENNNNILHVASLGGHVDMVEYVLSLNISDMECRGAYGRTPLMKAVEKGHLPLVKFLQNKGANINTVDDNNNNILHVASIGGHVDMVEYLVTFVELRGFDKRKNKDGDTPVQVAQQMGYDETVSFLQSRK